MSHLSNTVSRSSTIASFPPIKVGGLIGLLEMPTELKTKVVTCLSTRDLNALNIAVGKGTLTTDKHKSPMLRLKKLVQESRDLPLQQISKNIFTEHPQWETVATSWKEMLLTDKVWLLRIHELHLFGILKIKEIASLKASTPGPCQQSPELLKERESITKALHEVKIVTLEGKGLKKCPESICLLVNLSNLTLKGNNLELPPDVRPFRGLKMLNLRENKLRIAPELSFNRLLEILDLNSNLLTQPPDLSVHSQLTHLDLNGNQIKTVPLINPNARLKLLCIRQNPLLAAENTKIEAIIKNNNVVLSF